MHSSPFSEVAAHVCGLLAGLGAYAASGAFTQDFRLRVKIGMGASAACNMIIGGKINLLMHDFVSLALLRPISAYAGAELLKYVENLMHGQIAA